MAQKQLSLTQDQLSVTQEQLSVTQEQLSVTEDLRSQTREQQSQTQERLSAVFAIKSWRLTAPVRTIATAARGAQTLSARGLLGLKARLKSQIARVGAYLYARPALRARLLPVLRRFPRLRVRLAQAARAGALEVLRASALFDKAFYQSQFQRALKDPERHFLTQGAGEGRWPHAFFDSSWYLEQNSDVRSAGVNPLVHFVQTWATEGRWPNPYFDPIWYQQTNPDSMNSGRDPLTHYMEIGAKRLADPSPRFCTKWYLEQNPDVKDSGVNPLAHFLHFGQREGRLPRPGARCVRKTAPVTDAQLQCLKFSGIGREVALFVTHSPDGLLKPHVRHYLEALSREGVTIVLIVAADQPFNDVQAWLLDLVGGLFVRENKGFDFAAWAHVLRLHRELYGADILLLVNDSVFGPTNQALFHDVIARVRASSAHIIGLTASQERGWHLQSYFLAIKAAALGSFAFHQFIHDIVILDKKDDVIQSYEVSFALAMKASGLGTEALFLPGSNDNATILHWRELLDEGFPFLKVTVARDDIPGIDRSGWREAIQYHGYNVSLSDLLLLKIAAQEGAPRADAWRGRRIADHNELSGRNTPHVAFIGPWNFSNGLGVAARGYMAALMHANCQTNVLPIYRPFHVHHRVTPTVGVHNFVGPADVALIHLNPDAWAPVLDEQLRAVIDRARAKVGMFVWESRQIPESFVNAFSDVDVIWAPSHYCSEVFRSVTDTPVEVVPYVVSALMTSSYRDEQEGLRRELHLDPGERVILYIFDASSYLVRKNPVALVQAFGRSGLSSRGWRLVLKTKLLSGTARDAAELLKCCAGTRAVSILNRHMDSAEIGTLMDIADIYASSHCSEGFGLTIAEAMAKGKAVVGTDYGGSRDFLTPDCGFPVRCTEWTLEEDYGAYVRGTTWGLVDIEHLAESLIAAASLDEEARLSLAENSRRKIQDTLSPRSVAARMRESIDRLRRQSA